MKLIVNPHKIEIDKSPVNEREIDITKCEFEFADEITNDYVKEAYFTFNGTSYKEIIVNNQCSIPNEVLAKKGQVEIGVVAFLVENEEEIKRYNPSPAYFNTWLGSLKDNAENSEPITPSEMEQFEQALNDGLNEVANVDIDAEQLDNGMSVTITNRYGEDKTVYAYDGEKGETGATPNIQIGTVVTGDHSEVTRTGTNENPKFNFVLEKGDKGDTGNGIASVTKTSTSGLVDTYTITYTNGTTTTFDVTNGKSITNIAKTSTSGLEDTYTITYNDNTTSTFTVTNGNGISSIEKTGTQDNVDTYTIYYTNGTTSTFTVTNSTVTNQEFEELKAEHEELVNTLPRVEGTGESITLDNTAQYKMNVALSGNTSQTTYTGKNLLDYNLTKLQNNNTGGTWNNNVYTVNGVSFTYNEDGSITAKGEATSSVSFYINRNNKDFTTLSAGTYYFTSHEETGANNTWKLFIQNIDTNFSVYGSGSNKEVSKTISEDTNIQVSIYIYSGYNPNGATFYPMISTTSGGEYEPYVGGVPSPNPLYPQPIKKVTGNNSITVCGKNLFDINGVFYTQRTTGTINVQTINVVNNNANSNGYLWWNIPIGKNKQVTISYGDLIENPVVTNNRVQYFSHHAPITEEVNAYNSISTYINKTNKTASFTTTDNYLILVLRIMNGATYSINNIQVEYGSVATTYEPYQGATYPINLASLEYCKIGNYSDEFALSTGVQLFDKNNATVWNGYVNANHNKTYSNSDRKSIVWSCKKNTTYTISKRLSSHFRVGVSSTTPSNNMTLLSSIENDSGTSITIITGESAVYLIIAYYWEDDTLTEQEILDSIMINEGSTALPWEPYGIGNWYIKKNIGKVVLDGTENGWSYSSQTHSVFYISDITNNIRTAFTPYSNYYLGAESVTNASGASNKGNNTVSFYRGSSETHRIFIINDSFTADNTGRDNFKVWLSTHNTIIYYVLETPTSEAITDTTLIEQLNNLYNQIKSCKGQTNITQTNTELPFNIDASALYDLNNLISRVATLETEV